MEKQIKKRVFSGIKPSGALHIGNYLGAVSQWVGMQDEYDCVFSVVDYHAITVRQNPTELKKKILEIAKLYLAAGIDPDKTIIFQQSDVGAHTELAWILNCLARLSDLNKMTQFKDKAGKNKEGVSVGLYDYPILMAADILLYNTDVVPVGDDQKQHVELTRDLARRFNRRFGYVFHLPAARLLKTGARIMALDNPSKKMSKSAVGEYGYIALTDRPEEAAKKIIRAQTDSGREIKYNPRHKAGISNLLTIYSLLTKQSIENLENEYHGRGYGEFKKDLAEEVKKFLAGFQKNFNNISDWKAQKVLADGAAEIRPQAEKMLAKVKTKIGIK